MTWYCFLGRGGSVVISTNRKWYGSSIVIGLALLLVIMGCQDQVSPIRIGINPWPGYEFLYLAKHKDFYAQEGVDVDLYAFSSLGDARQAFERGQIDMIACTQVELLLIHDRAGLTPKIVHLTDYSNGADVIVAKDPVTTVAELKGQTVAVEPYSLDEFILSRALEKANMTLDDIVVVPMRHEDMEEAFIENQIVAAGTYPSVSVKLINQGGNKIFSSAEIPSEVADVLAARADVLAQRGSQIEAIIRAFDRAVAYSIEQSDESYEIMSTRLHITPQEFRRLIEEDIRLVRLHDQTVHGMPGGPLERAIDRTADSLFQMGIIKQKVMAQDLVDIRLATGLASYH